MTRKRILKLSTDNSISRSGRIRVRKKTNTTPDPEVSSPVCYAGKEKFREGFEDIMPEAHPSRQKTDGNKSKSRKKSI
jgi:hypothetical protein